MPIDLTNLLRLFPRGVDEILALLVELLLIGLSINWCVSVLQGTRGTRPLKGVLMVLVVATLVVRLVAGRFGWQRLELLYQYFLVGMAFITLVAFQPELRRAVIRAGDVRLSRYRSPQSKIIATLLKAAATLSKHRHGALIAIERDVDLRGWAENGTLLNAEVTSSLLTSIFFPNSPLHDLGVIIKGDRVLAANCQFPIAESDEITESLGSRHLAAVGMSYETDALLVVVSEETGQISIADRGHLVRLASPEQLVDELEKRLGAKYGPGAGRARASWTPRLTWGSVRRALVVVPLTMIIWYLADQATQVESEGIGVALEVNAGPERIVEVREPDSRNFEVTLRGSQRAIDAIRAVADNKPAAIEWTLPRSYSEANTYSLPSAELLNRLPAFEARGLTVLAATPATLTFDVDELVTATIPIQPSSTSTRISDVTFSPATVKVAMRRREWERVPEDQRIAEVKLEALIKSAQPGKLTSVPRIGVERTIGNARFVRIEPDGVAVSFRLVEVRDRQTITGVSVQLVTSPQLWKQYDLVLADPNELRIDVEVEGDHSTLESLRDQDVRAWVTATPDLLVAPPEFRSVQVELNLPAGVTVIQPMRTVRMRLQERGANGQ
ncbi:MAG: diadenylate cyclase [Phycisphaerales bacterium]|nr:diadenylate cyclase [Phycisphaerales bacterium]